MFETGAKSKRKRPQIISLLPVETNNKNEKVFELKFR